jgi:hypothetical protein
MLVHSTVDSYKYKPTYIQKFTNPTVSTLKMEAVSTSEVSAILSSSSPAKK